MKTRSLLKVLVLVAAVGTCLGQGFDETWCVTVNGQTTRVTEDGGFLVENVSAPDQFGSGGPGSAPDFKSDDFIRAVAVKCDNGQTKFAFSEPFQFNQGRRFKIGRLTFTDTPPPFPEYLTMSGTTSVLNQIGQTTQLTVTGKLADGSPVDLTQRSSWTTYRTSNPAVATVGPDGLVSARDAGTVFITATNEGATGVIRLRVLPDDPLTTIEGFVQLENGSPVPDAIVSILGLDFETITDANGFYSMSGVPSQLAQPLTVRAAVLIGGESFVGSKQTENPVPAAITDGGIITLLTTGGGLGPVLLSGMDPEDHGTPGRDMIRDFFLFVVGESAISANPTRIVMLGSSASVGNIARSIAQTLGYSLTQVTGSQILDVNLFDYDAIYMGSSSNEVSGGISAVDIEFVNQRGRDIVRFVNAGGGLASFTQTHSNSYGWLQTVEPLEWTHDVGGSIVVTDAGEFFLSPSAVNVEPFHSGFLGPAGFFGLEVLATDSQSPPVPLIIGGLASIPPDCNGNGIADFLDISAGTSQDCDGNRIPDECERDCNANGLADGCDITLGTSFDVVGRGALPDGIPDECQMDANGNRVPDAIDIANGTSQDCNGNAVPDEADLARRTSPDCNANGVPDECDAAQRDCNLNGVPDECDIASGASRDCNANGVPDECDSIDVFDVPLASLVGFSQSCGGGSFYSSGTAAGFSWTDAGVSPPASVTVEFNVGVECINTGTPHSTSLNGRPEVGFPATSTSCSCGFTPGNAVRLVINPINYQTGAQNTLLITNLSSPFGLIPRQEWGTGIYARVTVRRGSDCNSNGVPDQCDIADGTSKDVIGAGALPDGIPDECQEDGDGDLVPNSAAAIPSDVKMVSIRREGEGLWLTWTNSPDQRYCIEKCPEARNWTPVQSADDIPGLPDSATATRYLQDPDGASTMFYRVRTLNQP